MCLIRSRITNIKTPPNRIYHTYRKIKSVLHHHGRLICPDHIIFVLHKIYRMQVGADPAWGLVGREDGGTSPLPHAGMEPFINPRYKL